MILWPLRTDLLMQARHCCRHFLTAMFADGPRFCTIVVIREVENVERRAAHTGSRSGF